MEKLSLKSIDKIMSIYERIQVLDAEILQIEKMAMLIAEKRTDIKFSLDVDDIEANEKEKTKCKFDEDGSLVSPLGSSQTMGIWNFLSAQPTHIPDKPKATSSISWKIEDKATLMILGVLLSVKQQDRSELMKVLERYGFKV